MSSLTFLLLWSALMLVVKGQGSVIFEITQPSGPIYEGAKVQLQCTVEGYSSATDTVIIYDNFNGFRNLAIEGGKGYDAPSNVVSSGIQQVGATHVLSVTINNIDISFSTTYSCYLAKKAGTIIDQVQLSLNVLLSTPPSCSVTPGEDLVWYEGDQVTLTCTSDVVEANPLHVVTLMWNVILPNDNVPSLPSGDSLTSSQMIVSTVSPVLTTDHDGVTFTCLRDADKQNCSIGPIAVQIRNVQTTDGLLTTGIFSKVTVILIIVIVTVILIIFIISAICCIKRSRKSVYKSNVSNPANMNDDETYIGLDATNRQPESVYQGVKNQDPDRVNTADNYQSLDATSRLSTAEYQGIYHDVKMEEHNDQDVIYHEYMDPMTASAQSQSTVPIPPTVSGIDNVNGLYVNVKEAANNRKT